MSESYVRRQIVLARNSVIQIRGQKTADVSASAIDGIIDALSRASDGLDGLVARQSRCGKCEDMRSSLQKFSEDMNAIALQLNTSVEQIDM
jgi:bacterioferritin-associated ferredoxin